MTEEKYLLDILFEIFEKTLPKYLQPHAFKIVFGAIVAGILAIIGYISGWNTLLGFLAFIGILYGTVALWIFLKWLFTGKIE